MAQERKNFHATKNLFSSGVWEFYNQNKLIFSRERERKGKGKPLTISRD
jgi:hypothetical protein